LSACFAPISRNIGATDYAVAQDGQDKFNPKYRDPKSAAVINKGDSVFITLQQAFIEDFSERWERITSKFQFTPVRGEIAVLAKVYQSEDEDNLSFGKDFKEGARLVYYSDDVRSGGHLLNFSAIPIYGPIKYNGGAIVIELAILELDLQETAQLKGVLNQLVQFGKVAYPPAAPELKILDALGGQLLDGEQDDWELSYKFFLYPATGSGQVNTATLEVGNYVLVNRKANLVPQIGAASPYPNLDWKKYRFDHSTGLVHVCDDQQCTTSKRLLQDNTYLVLQIDKGHSSVKFDVLQKFDEFRESLLTNVKEANRENLEQLKAASDLFAAEIEEEMVQKDVGEQLQLARNLIKELSDPNNTPVKSILATQLYNILIEKINFPEDDGGNKIGLSDNQRFDMLRNLYNIVQNPATFPVSLEKADIADAATFIGLLK